MKQQTTRIGLIGYGQIGKAVHAMIDKDAENGMEVVFIHDQYAGALQGVPDELVLEDLGGFMERQPNLVVEMAHPEVTRKWGKAIVEQSNYMLVSVTAMADPEVERMLQQTTRQCGTRVFIPHGGVVGMEQQFIRLRVVKIGAVQIADERVMDIWRLRFFQQRARDRTEIKSLLNYRRRRVQRARHQKIGCNSRLSAAAQQIGERVQLFRCRLGRKGNRQIPVKQREQFHYISALFHFGRIGQMSPPRLTNLCYF